MRLEAEVAGMKKNEALAHKRIIEEFKSFEDYQEEVENAASKYFGEGFDFCERQLAYHHLTSILISTAWVWTTTCWRRKKQTRIRKETRRKVKRIPAPFLVEFL